MHLSFSDCDVLCFNELPPDEVMGGVIEWLEEREGRQAVVFSNGQQTPHPQIWFCAKDDGAISELARDRVFLQFDYVPLHEGDELFFAKVESIVEGVFLSASDYQNRGVDRFHNLVHNSAHFHRAFETKHLFGKFNQVPAIICGAGPSLEEEASHLRLLGERALIFAGGASLSSLSGFGVRSHFGGLIDPHPPAPIDFASSTYEIPHFFQSRVHPDKLATVQGPLLWTPGSEQDFFEEFTFEGGWNVSTYLTAIACHLGCNPIVLVGVDLCGEAGGKVYAAQMERDEEMIKIEGGIATKRDWLFAADFLSNFAQRHPEVSWINCSNGIEFAGFEKKHLHEISFESEYDLRGMIHAAISSMESGVMQNFVGDEVIDSLLRASRLCTQLISHLEKTFPEVPKNDGEYTLLTIELEREEAYICFARQVWQVWKPVFLRSMPQGLPTNFGIELNQWLFIKEICDDARQI